MKRSHLHSYKPYAKFDPNMEKLLSSHASCMHDADYLFFHLLLYGILLMWIKRRALDINEVKATKNIGVSVTRPRPATEIAAHGSCLVKFKVRQINRRYHTVMCKTAAYVATVYRVSCDAAVCLSRDPQIYHVRVLMTRRHRYVSQPHTGTTLGATWISNQRGHYAMSKGELHQPTPTILRQPVCNGRR